MPNWSLLRPNLSLTCAELGPAPNWAPLEPNWDPTWCKVGPNLGQGSPQTGPLLEPKLEPMGHVAEVGPKAIQICHRMTHMDIQVMCNITQLGTFSRQRHTKLVPTETQKWGTLKQRAKKGGNYK